MTRVIGGTIIMELPTGYEVKVDEVVHEKTRDRLSELVESEGGTVGGKNSEREEWFAGTSYLNGSSDRYSCPKGDIEVGMVSVDNRLRMWTTVTINVTLDAANGVWEDDGMVRKLNQLFGKGIPNLQYDTFLG